MILYRFLMRQFASVESKHPKVSAMDAGNPVRQHDTEE
jgi:hypothetical protein